MIKTNKLSFAKGNAKLKNDTAIFSLPAGWTCPGAAMCLSKSNRITGKITDGKNCSFRCYAASSECLFPNIRKSRWANFEKLKKAKSIEAMEDLINLSLPRKGIKLCRIHASGDFFSQEYFDAWILVAARNPKIIFYTYTKALNFWLARKDSIPNNMKLVASRGGIYDNLIKEYGLRSITVVFSEEAAVVLGLPIDHDDKLAWKSNGDFAILLHGTQPAGSFASKASYAMRTKGKNGYKSDYFGHYK